MVQSEVTWISDRGGGIPHSMLKKVFQYHFTTANDDESVSDNGGAFGTLMEAVNQTTAGPLCGFGFGLPVSKAYAEYLGGSISLETMQGIGTDVFLRLRHIEGKQESFRI
ncbi:branched-chain alpha-ketoacid dehydrogenase kinase-like [Lytechinus pictus]|uniref:branched-chain alpha-ketoacid dehydrogenase kinase-like n=1 Tax=Lytechinus pictus TaxID=7653 RepID=UPI0030BA2925